MNDTLPLSSFEIEGYRGIRHLRLPELGRVNLFVGKNNAGKSSLLEAIRLCMDHNPGTIAAIFYEAVREHSDFSPHFQSRHGQPNLESEEIEAVVAAVESLFFGGFAERPRSPIRLTDISGRHSLSLHGPRSRSVAEMDLFGGADDEVFFSPDSPLLTITTPTETREIPLRLFTRGIPIRYRHGGDTLRIPAGGLAPRAIRELWDRLAVSGNEVLVEDAMRTVWPSFERAISAGDTARRSVFVKYKDVARAVPLQSLGDGVQRVFSIAVALALAADGALVIDEVENGLHHSAQQEVWNSVFGFAERLNVQVFATTHSWESVVAFQLAANRSPAFGMLYRLEREGDGRVYAERYTEQDVAIAAEQQVEVR